jgi:hypothetical protein
VIEILTRNGTYQFRGDDSMRIAHPGSGGRNVLLSLLANMIDDDDAWTNILPKFHKPSEREETMSKKENEPSWDELTTSVPSEPMTLPARVREATTVISADDEGPMIYQGQPREELPPFASHDKPQHIEFTRDPLEDTKLAAKLAAQQLMRDGVSGTAFAPPFDPGHAIGRRSLLDMFPAEAFQGNDSDVPEHAVPNDVVHPKVEHAARLAREMLAGSQAGGALFGSGRLDIPPKSKDLMKLIEFLLVCDSLARDETSTLIDAMIDEIAEEQS